MCEVVVLCTCICGDMVTKVWSEKGVRRELTLIRRCLHVLQPLLLPPRISGYLLPVVRITHRNKDELGFSTVMRKPRWRETGFQGGFYCWAGLSYRVVALPLPTCPSFGYIERGQTVLGLALLIGLVWVLDNSRPPLAS